MVVLQTSSHKQIPTWGSCCQSWTILASVMTRSSSSPRTMAEKVYPALLVSLDHGAAGCFLLMRAPCGYRSSFGGPRKYRPSGYPMRSCISWTFFRPLPSLWVSRRRKIVSWMASISRASSWGKPMIPRVKVWSSTSGTRCLARNGAIGKSCSKRWTLTPMRCRT